MKQARILIVDDDDALRTTLAEALESQPYEIHTAADGPAAIAQLDERDHSVVVTDLKMKEVDGLAVLEEAKRRHRPCRVVILTGHGSREVAVRAMQQGATYYIEKPVDLAEFRTKVAKCVEEHDKDVEYEELRSRLDAEYGIAGFVGQDAKILRLLDTIRQIAPTRASVLILGESGTGKELVARAVHQLGRHHDGPFVALNCGGLAEGMIESELFGHVKGAFTGAVSEREGKFEYADGGTLFLDEIGEMPLQTQVKLLRVLEEQSVTRVGSNQSRPVDVRLIAATNAELEKKVQSGAFRDDLYYRLRVIELRLPPLRERRGDVRILAEHFLQVYAQAHDKDVDAIDRDALVALMNHDWPGNVRELRNAIESMVVRARGNILTVADLPPEIGANAAAPEQAGWEFLVGKTAEEVERNHIRVTLESTGGNRVRAAAALGISERTLYRKIREFGL